MSVRVCVDIILDQNKLRGVSLDGIGCVVIGL